MAVTAFTTNRRYGGLAAEERRAGRRRRLLDAGLELFGTRGWQATTVTAICERASLTPRYFYESFRDRDDVLVAIFEQVVAEVAREVDATLRAGPTGRAGPPSMREVVHTNIAAWVAVAAEDPRKGRVVFVEAMGSEALMRHRLQTARRFAGLITEHARTSYDAAGSRALDLAGLVVAGGLIETMIEWLEGRLDRTADEVVDDFTSVCLASIEAAAQPHTVT